MNTLLSFFTRAFLKRSIYPGIAGVLLIAACIVFAFVARFIADEINRALIIDATENSFSVDLASYRLVAARLGLPALDSEPSVTNPATQDEAVTTAEVEPSTKPETILATSTSAEAPDPQDLSITIYNATGIPGLASQLKTELQSSDFVVTTIGNAELQDTNTISIKDSAQEYSALLTSALPAEFNGVMSVLPEDADTDVVITIGQEW